MQATSCNLMQSLFNDLMTLDDCRAFVCGWYRLQSGVAEETLGVETRCKWSCMWTGDGLWYNQRSFLQTKDQFTILSLLQADQVIEMQ